MVLRGSPGFYQVLQGSVLQGSAGVRQVEPENVQNLGQPGRTSSNLVEPWQNLVEPLEPGRTSENPGEPCRTWLAAVAWNEDDRPLFGERPGEQVGAGESVHIAGHGQAEEVEDGRGH